MPIQQANWKINLKRKTSFIEVLKGCTYIWIGSVYTNSQKKLGESKREQKNILI